MNGRRVPGLTPGSPVSGSSGGLIAPRLISEPSPMEPVPLEELRQLRQPVHRMPSSHRRCTYAMTRAASGWSWPGMAALINRDWEHWFH